MPELANDLQRFLLRALVDLLGVPETEIHVRWSISRGHWVFAVEVPDEVLGLVLGSRGRHVDAFEMLVRMRALRIGARERIFVHVVRGG